MKCLHCDCEKFEVKNVRVRPEIKGEELDVVAPAFVCTKCHNSWMDGDQMNALRKSAADKYRELHHLLTSEQIIKYRNALGMSQIAFANYLKVGEASIKRWETYYVQDLVQDDHIRLKCDEAYAELNALEVHWKSRSADIFSGNRLFCLELFKQAVRYLIGFAKSPLFLNKALFYADFKHFQLHGISITGARYIHLDYGPCPDQYQNIYQLLLEKKILVSGGHHILKSAEKSDLTVFSDSEKEVLKLVAQIAHEDGGKKLLKISHEEEAYKKTEPLRLISYEFSKKLKI
ncbi:MAG TPA: type II TA system antitoxin MqsA family protein [Chlamydiales bacterium]|jgi:putative zinc finger/helix-turn-helix YgiT family protein